MGRSGTVSKPSRGAWTRAVARGRRARAGLHGGIDVKLFNLKYNATG
jgi:hypothetical protein